MPPPLTLIFMGTPQFAVPCLRALMESPHRVVAVYTQPPRPAHRGKQETLSPVHQLAAQHGIPVHTPTSLKDPEEQARFVAYGADAAVVTAYGLLLPPAILEAPRLGCLNVHPSKLPRWRGAAPLQRTIMAGDTETACTIMQMNAGLDTGDILLEEPVTIPPEMDAGDLHDLMAGIAGPLVLRALEELTEGTLIPHPQASDGATYAPKIRREEYRIDWARPGQEILNRIRGLSPAPGAYFEYRGERIKLLRAAYEPGTPTAVPGMVMDEGLGVTCPDGILRLHRVQRQGKKPMDTADFLRGFAIEKGVRLA